MFPGYKGQRRGKPPNTHHLTMTCFPCMTWQTSAWHHLIVSSRTTRLQQHALKKIPKSSSSRIFCSLLLSSKLILILHMTDSYYLRVSNELLSDHLNFKLKRLSLLSTVLGLAYSLFTIFIYGKFELHYVQLIKSV